MKDCFVGFDTSNYTTSVAVCDREGRVVANLKAPLPVKDGERGLRQSDALFAHTRNLPALTDRLGEILREGDLRPVAVGVSAKPRDVEGSYMPCFLAGIAAAHSFAAACSVPIYEVSHQNGHVMAALYSADALSLLERESFLAFHVSGGTTEVLLIDPREAGFSVTLVGETADINAGQAIDRVGVALGLSFPCGRELERLASLYSGRLSSRPVCVRDGRCSLSGVENLALRLWNETGDPSADGGKVGEHAAQPSCVDIESACALCLFLDGFLRLLFGADEQNVLALGCQLTNEAVCFFELLDALLQVDDVDTVSLGEDVLRHLGVPSSGLVTEVNAGLQELFHRNYCHFVFLLRF